MSATVRKTREDETGIYAADGSWAVFVRRFWGQICEVTMIADAPVSDECRECFRKAVKRMARGFFGLSIVHAHEENRRYRSFAIPCNVDPEPLYESLKKESTEVFLEELHSRTGSMFLSSHWMTGHGELDAEFSQRPRF